MARLPRLVIPRFLHVVHLHAHAGNPFPLQGDEAKAHWLSDLKRSAEAPAIIERVAIHGYVLLDHEVWLLVTPPTAAALSELIQAVGRRFARWYHRNKTTQGSIWSGRYGSIVLQNNLYLKTLNCLERLSIRQDFMEHSWSSAAFHAGLQDAPWLTPHPMYWQLGNTPFARQEHYARSLTTTPHPQEIDWLNTLRQAARSGWALGDDAFLNQLALLTPRRLSPRQAGRPRK